MTMWSEMNTEQRRAYMADTAEALMQAVGSGKCTYAQDNYVAMATRQQDGVVTVSVSHCGVSVLVRRKVADTKIVIGGKEREPSDPLDMRPSLPLARARFRIESCDARLDDDRKDASDLLMALGTLVRAENDVQELLTAIRRRGQPWIVQVCEGGEWVPCVREDLMESTGYNFEELPQARFATKAEAETFIPVLCGLMHMGGDPAKFRAVRS